MIGTVCKNYDVCGNYSAYPKQNCCRECHKRACKEYKEYRATHTAKIRHNVKSGAKFTATLRKSRASKDWYGYDHAGLKRGVFIADGIGKYAVSAGERIFRYDFWKFEVAK